MKTFLKFLLIGMAVILFIGLLDSVVAEQTVKTINVPLGYEPVVNAQDIKYYNLSVEYPDRISKVISMEILVQGDYLAGTDLYGGFMVGNNIIYCTPQKWTIYRDSDNYEASFDCTPKLKNHNWKGGNLIFGIMGSKAMGNVKPRIRLTYQNDPKVSITVHGTEYKIGQVAKAWVQLINSTGSYVNNASCQVDIYTPDGEELVEKGTMTYSNHDGIYYYDYSTDSLYDGVFPIIARCYYGVVEVQTFATAFTLNTGNVNGGSYTDTWVLDGTEHKIEQSSGEIDFEYEVGSMCGLTANESFLTGFTVTVNSRWKDSVTNDNIVIHVKNQTSGTWIALPNNIITPNDRVTVSNFVTTNNITRDGYADATGLLELKFNDTLPTQGGNKKIEMDLVQISCDELADSEWQEVKGSSELHVNAVEEGYHNYELTNGQLTNTSFRDDFTFHFTVSSLTGILRESQEVELNLWIPFPCDHVLNVQQRFDNGSVINKTYTEEISDAGRCIIEIQQDLEPGTNYDIEVVSENYWKVELYEHYSTALLQSEMINISCQNYVLANNLTNFTIPIQSIPYGADAMWLSCASYLDKFYHYNEVLGEFFYFANINYNFTYEEMQSLETSWLHKVEVEEDLDTFANTIFNGLNLGNSYSLGLISDPYPPTNPLYATYFASISSSYLNYASILGIPQNVWEYTPRNVSVEVNTTEIAEQVWNYNGTVNSNLISQFVLDIWSATTRTLTSFGTLVADVWGNENRTLTASQELWTGQTEYSTTETTGKVVVRITDTLGNTVTGADCNLSIFYPNNTQYTEIVMNETSGSYSGIYLVDFNHSGEIGVHPYAVNCVKGSNDYFFLNTYHVFPVLNASNIAQETWNYSERNLTFFPTQVDLTNYSEIQNLVQQYGNTDSTNYTLVQELITNYGNNDTDLTNYTLMQDIVALYGNDDNTNYTEIENLIINYGNNNSDLTNYTRIEEAVITFGNNNSDLTNYTIIQDLIIAFGNNESDLTNYTLIQDLITAFGNNDTDLTNYTEIQNLVTQYGNEDNVNYTLVQELVTNYGNSLTANDLWNYSNRTLTSFPFNVNASILNEVNATVSDVYVGGTEYQEGDNGKIAVRLIKAQGGAGEPEIGASCNGTIFYPNSSVYLNESALSDLGSGVYTLDFAVPTTVEGVYPYYVDCEKEGRNYFSLDTFHVSNVGDDVWLNSPNRTLTDYNQTAQTDLTNYTEIQGIVTDYGNEDNTNYDLIENKVWNSSTRELTYYPTTNLTLDNGSIQAIGDAVWQYDGNITTNILNQVALKVECYITNLFKGDDEWAIEISNC